MKAIDLRTRFLAVSLGMVALLGLASLIFIRITLIKKLEVELQKRGASIAIHLAEEVAPLLVTQNFSELQAILLKHVEADQDLEYIFLENSEGVVLAHSFGELLPSEVKSRKSAGTARQAQQAVIRQLISGKGQLFDIPAPVLKNQLATVHVGISGKPLRRSVADIITHILWIIAMVLVCGGILAVFFTLRITKPLTELAGAAKKIGSGDQGQRIPVTTGDEIGRLAGAFNQMISDLQANTVSRAHLERLVQERTAALSEAVTKLEKEIAERERAEVLFKEINAKLLALIEAMPDAVFFKDANGRYLTVNKKFEEYTGISRETAIGATDQSVLPPDVAERNRKTAEEIMQSGKQLNFEETIAAKDGKKRYLENVKAPIFDSRGNLLGLLGVSRDVTGRKQAEDEILRLSRHNELILNCAGEGIFGLDKNGIITFINPAAAEMLGWTVKELIGRPSHETFHHSRADGSTYPREECPFHKALNSGHEHHVKDELFWRKDGTIFPVEYIGAPIKENGDITGAVIVFKDISERKKAEEALKSAVIKANEEKAKTEAIIAGIGDAINIQDTSYRILYQNEASVKIYGHHVGEYCYSVFQEKDRVCERCHLAMAFTDGKSHTLEQKRTTEQGTFYYDITGSPLRNADGEIVAGIELIRDVTERRKLLDQLENITENLAVRVQEEVEKSRVREQVMQIQNRHAAMGEMIDNIAHQWRQPLNNLGLIMQGIKHKFTAGDLTVEKMQEQTKTGMSLIKYMSQTISDFTHFLRHDKQVTTFRIKDVAASALGVAETSLKRNSVTVMTEIDDNVVAMGFRNEYIQVIVNILNNARDIFVERSIPSPVIILRAYREGHTAVLTITDNGGGIESAVMNKIFTPNFTTKGPHRGTGIGLYMSKIIIEKNMQGRLTVANNGGGAEFKVEVRHGG